MSTTDLPLYSTYISEQSFRNRAKITLFVQMIFRKVQAAFRWLLAMRGSSRAEMALPPVLMGMEPLLSCLGQH